MLREIGVATGLMCILGVRVASAGLITFDFPGAEGFTGPVGISNSGAVVGGVALGTGFADKNIFWFERRPDGSFLPPSVPLPGPVVSGAYGINASGTVVGRYTLARLSHI